MGLKINIKNKSFGRKQIITDLKYEFSDIGLYIIRGKSGRGKTTLLRIIAGLDNDFSGEISGVLHDGISVHFQEYRLFDTLTALENVYMISFEKATEKEILIAKNLLLELGLREEDLSLYPRELSGGMKMRVSIARAMLKSAKVLLLDEPTKELDTDTKRAVINLINKKSRECLVITVTHEDDLSYFECPTVIEI